MLLWAQLTLLACAPVASRAPAVATAPAEGAPREVALMLDPADLTVDARAGTATYTPGAGVRSAHYDHYVFDLSALERALGGRPGEAVAVVVTVGPGRAELRDADGGGQQPIGGFRDTTYRVLTVRRAP